jgi:hypothetical protein
VRDIVAAGKTATLARFVSFEPNAPVRLAVGSKCSAVADLLAILACEVKVVLTGIAKSPVAGGTGPLPVASLREEFD